MSFRKRYEIVPAKAIARSFRTNQATENYVTAEDEQDTNPDQNLEVDRSGTLYKYAVFCKALPHNSFGEVEADVFNLLIEALESGEQSEFDAIELHPSSVRKLVNPQASIAYNLHGQDSHNLSMLHSPSITSEQTAGEMMEVYEMAMHRDIPFSTIEAGSDAATVRAVATLNAYGANFYGPKESMLVTPKSLFRGIGQDELYGPYVSQFLVLPFNYGNLSVTQLIKEEGDEASSTAVATWLDILNGIQIGSPNFTSNERYAHTPRMLGSYVHNDAMFQAYYNAAQILLQNGAPFDANIPSLTNEANFATLGGADLLASIAEVAKLALKSAWNHKWRINLRLRPEVLAGRIHFEDTGAHNYGIDPSNNGATTIAAMKAFNNSNFSNDTVLLPLMYPEGSPVHPEYPAGHAVLAGACITVLKAWFDTSKTWTGDLGLTPKHSIDGTSLIDYMAMDASDMTLLGEINKLASNMALGRNMAGVHYRCAGDEGIVLGEKVAIAYLKDLKATYNEEFDGWNLIKLDGSSIVI